MEYNEAKVNFIQTWGELGINWGINKTMGQIHGLLLIETEPLNCDSIMADLKISRGNAHMNLQTLVEWGLIYKKQIQGERKDFYEAEKDIWKVFKQIIRKRKEKELHPMIDLFKQVSSVQPIDPKSAEFIKMMHELTIFSDKADRALENLVNSKSNFLVSSYFKMLR